MQEKTSALRRIPALITISLRFKQIRIN